MQKLTQIAVVYPAFNEEENIQPVIERTIEFLRPLEINFQVIVVNDGSKDKTGQLIDQLSIKYPGLVIPIHHPVNRKYGAAVRTGLQAALASQMEWVFFSDSDQQFDICDLAKLMEKVQSDHCRFVIGYRMSRADSFRRRLNGLGWTLWNCLVWQFWVRDVDCAFKLMHRDVLLATQPLKGEAANINPELIGKARKRGFRVEQVGVSHYPRVAGEQTGAKFSVILASFVSSLRLRMSLE